MNVLFLAGSFHKKSYSQAILRVIEKELDDQHCAQHFAIEQLPFYNPDLSKGGNALADKPEIVQRFIQAVESCAAIIVSTPEYNHSIPAVLKNAIDWASRPAFNSCLKDKPITIFTQAGSEVGGARAQAHLKLIFDSTLSIIYPSHEHMIAEVDKKFDADLNLIDEPTRLRIKRHTANFLAWAGELG